MSLRISQYMKFFRRGWCILKFRHTLTGDILYMWDALRAQCRGVELSDREDTVTWNLIPRGFSVRSLYRALKMGTIGFPFKTLWKFKIPAKVKVFLWLVVRNSVLTKDVLHQRGWTGDRMCQFCGANESITHLFSTCPPAWYIWNVAWCEFGFKYKTPSMQHLLGGGGFVAFTKKNDIWLQLGWQQWYGRFGKHVIMLVIN